MSESRESDDLHVAALAIGPPDSPAFRVRARMPAASLRAYHIFLHHHTLLDQPSTPGTAHPSSLKRGHLILSDRRRFRHTLDSLDPRVSAVLLQRQLDYLPVKRLERIAIRGRRLIYDVDDAIWLDTRPEAEGHRMAWLKNSRRKCQWLARRAETVIVGNRILGEYFHDLGAHVVVIPSLIDLAEFTPRPPPVSGGRVTLGWIGSASTAPHLATISRALERLAAELPEICFDLAVVGGRAPALDGIRVHAEPWSLQTQRRVLQTIDIGLMPLPDSPWTRGKCGYKALQYMAAGVPTIASDVGVSRDIVKHGIGGFVVESEDEWGDALRTLALDARLRGILGRSARARVAEHYSVDAWAPLLAKVLRGQPITGATRAGRHDTQ